MNIRNLLLTCAMGAVTAYAQDDITAYYLQNSLFDTNYDYQASQTGNVAQEMRVVEGWTNDYSIDYTIVGVYQVGTKKTYNSAVVPSQNVDGKEEGGVLALSTGWDQSLKLYQEVTLPAGKYRLVSAYFNGDASKTGGRSLLGWIPQSGTSVLSKVASFDCRTWVKDTLAFELTATTKGRIQIGFGAVSNGSANSAKIAVDYVKLFGQEMAVDKSALSQLIATAVSAYGDGKGNGAAALKTAIDEAKAVADNSGVTMKTVLETQAMLQTALDAYRRQNISEENPLDKTSCLTNPSFEEGTGGWTVDGLQRQGNSSFTRKHGAYYMEKWTGSGSVGSASARQVVKELPDGIYKLTVSAQNYSQSATSTKNTGAYIFAGNQQTTVYTPADYSVTFTSIMGEAEIGFVAEEATGNWIAVDNFRLYQIGEISGDDVLAEVKRMTSVIEERLPKASTLLSAAQNQQVSATLAAARKLTTASAVTEIRATVKQLMEADAKVLLAYNLANATEGTGTAPAVTQTNHYVATGATQALMRAVTTGSNILERGVCWSTAHEPTVLDERTTKNFALKGNLFHIKGLKPATVYYLRPYVMNKTYQVAYGDEVKIVTIDKGTCTWSWDNGAPDAAANDRCRTAMEQTIDYFNEWTGIKGFHLSGHYGAQTPTADCSYGGWMRIGPNAAYQAIGTVLHETGHGVGVGTHWRWYDCADTRESTTHGKWLGREANDVLFFLENDYSGNIAFTGDKTHGWGTGDGISFDWLVNGADKDRHQELQYIGGMCILRGLFIDGLCPTNDAPNGIAGYTYNFDDTKKYYLMNKNAGRGLGKGLLRQRSETAVSWEENLTDEALSDSAAWYMEYNANTGMYLFRNAATQRYLSHNTGIQMRKLTNPGSTEQFQLMPDRTNVRIGQGSTAVTTHGYWMTWQGDGSKSMNANTMLAGGYGNITQVNFDYSSSATTQQWIIISEDELPAYRAAAVATAIRDVKATGLAGETSDRQPLYDLQGRRVTNPARGLYIVNGRKVVVK